jgi:hypothetical protein
VLNLFFFGNRLVLPQGEARQPLSGLANAAWALGFLPLVMLFLPKLAGLAPIGIPYIWFPIALAGIGLFDVLSWGYEDDPAGAGPELGGDAAMEHRERATVAV